MPMSKGQSCKVNEDDFLSGLVVVVKTNKRLTESVARKSTVPFANIAQWLVRDLAKVETAVRFCLFAQNLKQRC